MVGPEKSQNYGGSIAPPCPLMEPPSSPSPFKSPSSSSHLHLYTIPSHSFWFSWDSIHDTERIELREFFDGSSFTRTPKIYKEYRDFIISKYREDPSRRLTFTALRKSLVGDVSILFKVFKFLDKWGLINFGAPPPPAPPEKDGGGGVNVKVEEGAPVGVRVVGTPNTLKPLKPPPVDGDDGGGDVGGVNGFKVSPPLASFSDVFGEVIVCGNCKDKCGAKYYECTKEKFVICLKCFEKGAHGENKSSDDFKLNDTKESNAKQGGAWSETETLLLLESVLKYGDDWELVAQNVQTKSKLECISRLIELPFGELMLGSHGKLAAKALDQSDAPQEQKASIVSQEKSIVELDRPQDNSHEVNNHAENNHHEDNGHHQEIAVRENAEDMDNLEPPLKSRLDSSDSSRPMMEQVVLISAKVVPRIIAAAANASVSVLCDGNPLLREVFYSDDHFSIAERKSGNLHTEMERALQSEDSEMKEASHPTEIDKPSAEGDSIPIALRMRAAVATALGAAAAHTKTLADQEEREIERLMAFIIETQVKKLQRKVKNFEVLEHMMEKEHALLDSSKSDIIAERLATLQRIFGARIPRLRDFSW